MVVPPPISIASLDSGYNADPTAVAVFSQLTIKKFLFSRQVSTAQFIVPASTVLTQGEEIRIRTKGGSYVGSFDGSTGYIKIGTTGFPSGSSSRSLFVWVYLPSYPATYGVAVSYGAFSSTDDSFGIGVNSSGYVQVYGNGDTVTSTLSVPLNSWTLIGAVYAGGTTVTLFSGLSSSVLAFAGTLSTSLTAGYIGCWGGSSNFLGGYISDPRLYTTLLSGTIDPYLVGGYDIINGQVGRWTLNQGSGTPVYDQSWNGNGGAVSGGVTWTYVATSPFMTDTFGGYVSIAPQQQLAWPITAKDYGVLLQGQLPSQMTYWGLTPDVIARELIQGVNYGSALGAVVGWGNKSVSQMATFSNGTSAYTIGAVGLTIPSSSGISISARFKTTYNSGVIFATSVGSIGSSNQIVIDINTSGDVRVNLYDGSSNYLISPLAYNDGNIHHLFLSFNNTVARLYIDGTLVGTLSLSYSFGNFTEYFIGGIGAGSFFVGQIDDVKVWSRALSPVEANADYNGFATMPYQYNGSYSLNTNLNLWLNSATINNVLTSGGTVGEWIDKSTAHNNGYTNRTGVEIVLTSTQPTINQFQIVPQELVSDALIQLVNALFAQGADIRIDGLKNVYFLYSAPSNSITTMTVGTNGTVDTWTLEDNLFYTGVQVTGGNQIQQSIVSILGSNLSATNTCQLATAYTSISILWFAGGLGSGVLLNPTVDYSAGSSTGIVAFTPTGGSPSGFTAVGSTDIFTITTQYAIPIIAIANSASALTAAGAQGPRIYPYSDPSLTTQADAQTVANQMIEYYGTSQYTGEFVRLNILNDTKEGDAVTVADPFRTSVFPLGSMSMQVLGIEFDFGSGSSNGNGTTLTLGTYLRNIYDFNAVVRSKLQDLFQLSNPNTPAQSSPTTTQSTVTLGGNAGVSSVRIVSSGSTTSYTMVVSDEVVLVSTGTSAFTVNLIAANAVMGKRALIIKTDTGVGTVVVTPNGSDKIEGASTKTLGVQYYKIGLVSGGTATWYDLGVGGGI